MIEAIFAGSVLLAERSHRGPALLLLGDELPPVSALDDTLAAWSVAAAREAAWNNAELIWHLSDAPLISSAFLGTLDGLTAVASKALLVPV